MISYLINTMGSTVCVRCGAILVPHLFCSICRDVLCFTCSSCFTKTDERIHIYCQDIDTINNNNLYLLDTYKLIKESESSQVNINGYIKTQKQLNDDLKLSSINLSSSYLNLIFDFIKTYNKYWTKILSISIYSSHEPNKS
jgi:hypothetical protein